MTQLSRGQAPQSNSKSAVFSNQEHSAATIQPERKALPLQSAKTNSEKYPIDLETQPSEGAPSEAESIAKENAKDVSISSAEPKMALVQQAPSVRHREMAVDCPDTFIAVTKTTPKYPPPKKNNQDMSSLKKSGLYYFTSDNFRNHERSNSSQDGSESSRKTPPTPRISELVQEPVDNNNEDKNVAAKEESKETEDGAKEWELGYMKLFKKYEEDNSKRKEGENRPVAEEEMLCSSLRGSKKLRALENKYFVSKYSGVENNAFQLEEEDSELLNSLSSDGKLVSSMAEDEPPELTKIYESSELMNKLQNIKSFLETSSCSEDLILVDKLLNNEEFQNILSLHNKVQSLCCFDCLPVPASAEAQELTQEIVNSMQDIPLKDAKELIDILTKPEFDHFISCHDQIAESQVIPDVCEEEELLTRVSQYTEESIKIVCIDKTTEPLGATVRNEGEAIVIGRIVKGGVAEKSGLLHEGDEILEVNGIEMRGKTISEVCDIMAGMSGTLKFIIVPSQYSCPKRFSRETVIHLKAHFDYEPDDDMHIPCRELGMSFQKGDVLHVVSQEDPNWWQAYREGEEDQMLAGLIPSKSFQQQREINKQAVVGDRRERKTKKGKLICGARRHKRKKKKLYNLSYGEDPDADQILTYEEVYLYYPRAQHKRPLVLIGPPKIGRHELRQRLMEDTNRFAAAVPHTSRPKKENENNGMDYHFITRAQFESDIIAGRFVEHGEYQKSYYGTSLDSIRCVINSGKTCVLNLHPQSLKILKKSDLKPFVVFIAPPSFEKLRQNCLKIDPDVKDEELKDIIEKAREMEEFYGHYFDLVLINIDVEKTYSELLHAVSVIEREPQWVPAIWLKDSTA